MTKTERHKLSCKNCLFADMGCSGETNGAKCRHYYPITEDATDEYIYRHINRDKEEYLLEYNEYISKWEDRKYYD